MNRGTGPNQDAQSSPRRASKEGRRIDWYHPGQSRTVEVSGVEVTVRFVGRKGRRGRIAITAPAGAAFHALSCSREELNERAASSHP